MLPDNQLSSITDKANFLVPDTTPLLDYELGGIGLNDPSQGLQVQIWSAFYEGGAIKLKPDGDTAPIDAITVADVTELSLAFDQNMRPTIAYVSAGQAYLYWYDTVTGSQVTTTLAADVVNPRVSLDDARPSQTGTSDIILAYIRDGQLCMRVQRERYLSEHVLASLQRKARLRQVGMSDELRFQFLLQ